MRSGAVFGLLMVFASVASASPIRVTIECEQVGRTKTCPAFLLGFVEANKVLLSSPRSSADVVLYATAREVATIDKLHLRFVGTIFGAPPVIELDVDIDTRADDDTQRAQIEPAFLRGISLFVAARHPKVVTITLGAPEEADVATPDATPWSFAFSLGGFANYTERYQAYNGWSNFDVSSETATSRVQLDLNASGGINRQPPLELDDGTIVSLDTKQWGLASSAEGAWLYDKCWSFGGATSVWRDDPKGQFRGAWNAKAGVEWDKYAADDPRGNRLAVLYFAGYQVERYNLRNVLREAFAQYPIHGLVASGTLRKDKVGLGLSLSVGGELIHPSRRYHVSASPFIEWQLGGHIDLGLSFSVTQRELPGPDETLIDPADYEQLSRLSFAEPLSMNGSLNVTIHWDRTNGARNDRFADL
jgi:hypothetical protein